MPAKSKIKNRYTKWVRFIRGIILDAGFSKSSGEPNIDAFYKAFSGALKKSGLSLSKTNFANLAKGPSRDPYGKTVEALALILSEAKGERVTVAMLDGLIDRSALEGYDEDVDESELPDESAAAEIKAQNLLDEILELPINARASIAPKLLAQLGRDWEYLDLPDTVRISRLLQREIDRRGIGLEAYAKKVLGGIIPLASLKAIYECRMPDEPLEIDQIVKLQENLKSIDGDDLDIDELLCLAPHLDRPLG